MCPAYDTGVPIPFPQTPIPLRFFEVPNTQAKLWLGCGQGEIFQSLMVQIGEPRISAGSWSCLPTAQKRILIGRDLRMGNFLIARWLSELAPRAE